jgi:hypothetical protein
VINLSGTKPYFFKSLRMSFSAARLFLFACTSTSRTSPSASTARHRYAMRPSIFKWPGGIAPSGSHRSGRERPSLCGFLATKTPTAFVMTLAVKGRIVMEVSNQRTLREIAREIEANWLNINNQGAKKALDCMKTMGAIEAPSFGDPNGYGVVGSFQRRGLRSSSLWKSPLPDRMRRKHLSERRDVVPGAEVEHRGQSARAADR